MFADTFFKIFVGALVISRTWASTGASQQPPSTDSFNFEISEVLNHPHPSTHSNSSTDLSTLPPVQQPGGVAPLVRVSFTPRIYVMATAQEVNGRGVALPRSYRYNDGNGRRYGNGRDTQLLQQELDGFYPMGSLAWRLLKERFGNGATFRLWIRIIQACIDIANHVLGVELPPLRRIELRSAPVFVKYVQTHINVLYPLFENVTVTLN
jgi:hypothetical protein